MLQKQSPVLAPWLQNTHRTGVAALGTQRTPPPAPLTGEVQVVEGVDDDAHQGEVESGDPGPHVWARAAVVQVVGGEEAVRGVNGLPLHLPPAGGERYYSSVTPPAGEQA